MFHLKFHEWGMCLLRKCSKEIKKQTALSITALAGLNATQRSWYQMSSHLATDQSETLPFFLGTSTSVAEKWRPGWANAHCAGQCCSQPETAHHHCSSSLCAFAVVYNIIFFKGRKAFKFCWSESCLMIITLITWGLLVEMVKSRDKFSCWFIFKAPLKTAEHWLFLFMFTFFSVNR